MNFPARQPKISAASWFTASLILFFILAFFSPLPAAADWPMFLKDRRHSSFAGKAPRPPLLLKWKFRTRGPIYSSTVISGGKLYVGSYDKKLYALDAVTGKMLWAFRTGGEILSTPAVSGGKVYFGSKDGHLYALDANSGKLLWSFTTEGEVLTSPVVADNKVYFGSNDLNLYAVDANTGKKSWRMKFLDYSRYSGIYSSPAYYNGAVFIAGKSGRIYSQDAKSGGRNWSLHTFSAIYSSPVIKDGVLYIAIGERKFYGIDVKTGRIILRKNLVDGFAYATPVITGDRIYLPLKDGHIKAIEKKKRGKVVADYKLPAPVNSSPVVTSNGFLYVGCEDGRLYAIDLILGEVSWSYLTGGGVHSSPAISNNTVYIGSKDGYVYAFGH